MAPARFTHHFLLHGFTTALEPGTDYLLAIELTEMALYEFLSYYYYYYYYYYWGEIPYVIASF